MTLKYTTYQSMEEHHFTDQHYHLEDPYKIHDIDNNNGNEWKDIKYVWILIAYSWSYIPNIHIRFKEVVKSFNQKL